MNSIATTFLMTDSQAKYIISLFNHLYRENFILTAVYLAIGCGYIFLSCMRVSLFVMDYCDVYIARTRRTQGYIQGRYGEGRIRQQKTHQ